MKRSIIASVGCLMLITASLSGCGQAANNTAGNLAGAANLKKYVSEADKQASDVNAQVKAAQSGFVNGDAATAIKYYKKAVALEPKSGELLTALGNVYRELKSDPKDAIPYYTKSTQVDPTYALGWYQLAYAEAQLGQTSAAKATIAKGLKVVKKSDPYYATLQAEAKDLPPVLTRLSLIHI